MPPPPAPSDPRDLLALIRAHPLAPAVRVTITAETVLDRYALPHTTFSVLLHPTSSSPRICLAFHAAACDSDFPIFISATHYLGPHDGHNSRASARISLPRATAHTASDLLLSSALFVRLDSPDLFFSAAPALASSIASWLASAVPGAPSLSLSDWLPSPTK